MYSFIVEQNNKYRAKLISKYIEQNMKDVDIISFCEAFDTEAREILILHLYTLGFKYSTPILDDNTNIFSNGGIFLISKYPILSYSFYIYKNAIGTDFLANKGIVKIHLKKDNFDINVFSTHLQSWRKYSNIRQKQLKELNEYIRKFRFIENDIVVLIGDFNTTSKNVITSMENYIFSPNIVSIQKYTFDSILNTFVGIDGADPNFYERVKINRGKISYSDICKKNNFDHTFYSNYSIIPKLSYTEILVPKVSNYYINIWKIGWFGSLLFLTNDLSDHFPVLSTFEFDDKS
jgi:phospholipase C